MILTPKLEPYAGQPDVDTYSQIVLWGGVAYIRR
jgi:hypothetical protein